MNDERSFESLFADRMAAERGSVQLPGSFYDDFRQRAAGTRQRRRWLALIKEPPMRISSTLAVGSPTARVAAIVVATLLLAVTVAGAGIAGSRLLAADGVLVVDLTDSRAYKTISDAIAAAEDGDTVLVRSGTYAESIAIGADITVQGDGERGSVVVQFAADGPAVRVEGQPFAYGLLLEGSDAHVANLTVQGPADDGSDPAVSGVYVVGGAPVIEGIDIVLSGDRFDYAGGAYYRRSAVRVTGGSTATVRDSVWDGYVRVFGQSNAPIFERNTISGQHIAISDGGQQPTVRGNTFLEGAAIRWDATGSGGLAEDNDISGWIGVDEFNDPVLRGNRIRGGDDDPAGRYQGAAIGIASGATPLIEGNEITDSAVGITVTGAGAAPEIRGNTIRGTTDTAIVVELGAAPTIDGNTIEDNVIGVDVREPSTATLSGNTFCGNEQDLSVPEGSVLTLEGNTVCQP